MAIQDEIRVGTSGWVYKDWKGVFYPENLPKKQWLRHYQANFNTLELNGSFYRLPGRATFAAWRKASPKGFLWSVKAHRMITHYTRLTKRRPLTKFLASVEKLDERLGVILFQLPPRFKFDAQRVRRFLGWLPQHYRYAIEARDASWFAPEALESLHRHGVALAIAESGGRFPSQEHLTADFAYLRFHGSGQLYASKYSSRQLRAWANKIRGWKCPAFVYFNNDVHGYAVENAFQLRDYLAGPAFRKRRRSSADGRASMVNP